MVEGFFLSLLLEEKVSAQQTDEVYYSIYPHFFAGAKRATTQGRPYDNLFRFIVPIVGADIIRP